MKNCFLIFIFFIVLGIYANAFASLTGDNVHLAHEGYNMEISGTTAMVGSGVEYTGFVAYDMDVDEDSFYLDFKTDGAFVSDPSFIGFRITDLDDSVGDQLIAISVDSSFSTLAPVIFTNDSVAVSLDGLYFTAADYVDVSLTFGQSNVPIPSTVVLLGIGLFGLAGISRRKQRGY